jgi:hypothetical protein
MATTTTITKMLFRRGNDSDRKNTILASGEPGFTLDTKRLWIGDGITPGGYPALSAANEHLIFKPENTPSAQILDLYVPGVSATLAGDTTYSRMFHAVDRTFNTDYGINLNAPGDGEIKYTRTADFTIDRSADGTINIGDGAIVITKSGGQKTVSMNVNGAVFSGTEYIFDNGNVTHFEDKSIDFNVGMNNGVMLPEGSGPTSERTGVYFAHKNYLSAGFVRIADSVLDCHVMELQPTVYKKDWDSTDICTIGRGMATDGWVNNDGMQVDTNEKAPKPVRIISARPGDGSLPAYSGEAHLVLEAGLMVYGSGDVSTGTYNAYKINQSLDSTSTPSFAGMNIGDGSDSSAMQVDSGGTGRSSFNTKSVIVSNDDSGSGLLDSIPLTSGQLIIGHDTLGPVAGVIGSGVPAYLSVTNTDGAITLKNKFAPNEFTVTDVTRWFTRWYTIQADQGSVTPTVGSGTYGQSELSIKTNSDDNLTTTGGGNAITISHDLVGSTIYGKRWHAGAGNDNYTYSKDLGQEVKAQQNDTGGSTSSGVDDGHAIAAIKINAAGHIIDAKTKNLDERFANIWQIGSGAGYGNLNTTPTMSPDNWPENFTVSNPELTGENGTAEVLTKVTFNDYGTVNSYNTNDLTDVFYTKWKTADLVQSLRDDLESGAIIASNSDKVDGLHAVSFIRSDANDTVVKTGNVAVNTDWIRKGSIGFGSAAAVDTTLKGETSEFEVKSTKNIRLTSATGKSTFIRSGTGTQSVADFGADAIKFYANNSSILELDKTNGTKIHGEVEVWNGDVTMSNGKFVGNVTGHVAGTVNDTSNDGSNQVHDLLVTGDLTINGAMTTTTSNAVALGDSIITLNADFTTGTPAAGQDCGLEVERGTSANAGVWKGSPVAGNWGGYAGGDIAAGKIWTRSWSAENKDFPVTFANSYNTYDYLQVDNAGLTYNPSSDTLTVGNIQNGSGNDFATQAWVNANQNGDFVSKANGGDFSGHVDGKAGISVTGLNTTTNSTTPGVHLGIDGEWAAVELKAPNGGFIDFGDNSPAEDMAGRLLYSLEFDDFQFFTKYVPGNYEAAKRVSISETGLYCRSDIIAYHSFSDARLKKDISLLDSSSSLEKILQLNGVTFKWKDEEGAAKGTQLGLIAQDVEKVVPEVIDEQSRITDPDTLYKRVDYDKLVPLLIESIKELSAKVEKLESQLK